MPNVEERIAELRDRLVRMESRMVQLGDHVGANLRVREKIDVKRDAQGDAFVEIDSPEQSLSRIVRIMREEGVTAGEVPLLIGGLRVAVIYPARITN
jgi:hypothetical protein